MPRRTRPRAPRSVFDPAKRERHFAKANRARRLRNMRREERDEL